MRTGTLPFTQEFLKDILDYNSETGEFRWIKPPKNHPRMTGKIAGCKRPGTKGDDYIYICIGGPAYGAHRLAMLWFHGINAILVDHKNRDGCDNRIENLRESTRLGNARNHSHGLKKIGLPVGVRMAKSGRFVARIRDAKKPVHIGTFTTLEAASDAYQETRKQLFGEFCPQ